ncbi:hypothetical protein PanWU01x14_081020 [Parasponia andersonii]|uniref:Uncharacterized protein n=1 Tax=Parasponia andersonii TaxID=3476 RepID=A0A2P5DAX0_PARAD|nr:hypothetical protein PanWU01x14_081020 [Parasponia andersonii]
MVMSRAEALTQTQSRAQSELGDGDWSTESVVGPEQVNEFQIMSKALGTRSRWPKGLGALLRLKNIGGQRATSTRQVIETIAILKQQLVEAEHARQNDETQRQIAEKEAENQRRLEETQRQFNDRDATTSAFRIAIEYGPPSEDVSPLMGDIVTPQVLHRVYSGKII